jgi:hypothetical protein
MKKEALKAAFKYTSDHDDSLGEVNLPGQTLTLVGLFFFFTWNRMGDNVAKILCSLQYKRN